MLADELESELLFKLMTAAMDNDKEDFIKAGQELYPNSTKKELEDDFDKITAT